MWTFRRAASLLLLLPVLALTACQEAPPEPEATASHTPGLDPGNPGGQPIVVTPDLDAVPLGLEPASTDALVGAVQNNDWPAFWNELSWEVADDFGAEVAVWGVLVVDGEPQRAFLTEAVSPTGDGPSEDIDDRPGSLIPSPDAWVPGDEWVPGEEFVPASSSAGSDALPAVASFFESDAWFPTPDDWIPTPDTWIPTPDQWVVNGIVDGIWTETEDPAPSEAARATMLVIPIAAEEPSGQQGRWGTAGILVGFEEAP